MELQGMQVLQMDSQTVMQDLQVLQINLQIAELLKD
jgi:hypothetical protein